MLIAQWHYIGWALRDLDARLAPGHGSHGERLAWRISRAAIHAVPDALCHSAGVGPVLRVLPEVAALATECEGRAHIGLPVEGRGSVPEMRVGPVSGTVDLRATKLGVWESLCGVIVQLFRIEAVLRTKPFGVGQRGKVWPQLVAEPPLGLGGGVCAAGAGSDSDE